MTPATPCTLCRSHKPKNTYTTKDLSAHIGCSAKFLRDEIAAGHLKAIRLGHGHVAGSRLLIAAHEADRYCHSLGVLHPQNTTTPLENELARVLFAYFQAMPQAAVLLHVAGDAVSAPDRVVAINRAVTALVGYTPDEMIGGHPWRYFVNPTEPPTPVAGTAFERARIRHKRGHVVDVIVSSTNIVVGGQRYRITSVVPQV